MSRFTNLISRPDVACRPRPKRTTQPPYRSGVHVLLRLGLSELIRIRRQIRTLLVLLSAAGLLTGCSGLHWPLFRRGPVTDRPSVVSRFSPAASVVGTAPRHVTMAILNSSEKITPTMLEQFATRLSTEMQLSAPGAVVNRVVPAGYSHEWPSDDTEAESVLAEGALSELPAPAEEPGIILPPPGVVTPAGSQQQQESLEITVVDFRPYQPMRMSLRMVLYQEPGHVELAAANAVWEALPDEHHPGGPWRQRLRQRLFDQARDPERHLQAISPNEFFRRVSQEIAMWYASSGAQSPVITGDPNSVVIESSWSVPGVPGPLP